MRAPIAGGAGILRYLRAQVTASIRKRTFVTLLAAAMLPLVLCDILLIQAMFYRGDSLQERYANEEMNTVTTAMQEHLGRVRAAAMSLSGNTIVRSNLRQNRSGSALMYKTLLRSSAQLRNTAEILVCNAEGSVLYASYAVPADAAYPVNWGILRAAGGRRDLAYYIEEGTLRSAQAVRTADGSILGYVLINTGSSGLAGVLTPGIRNNDDLYILSGTGRLLYSTNNVSGREAAAALREQITQTQGITGRDDNNNYRMVVEDETGLVIILQQPRSFPTSVREMIMAASALAVFLGLLMSLFLSLLLTRGLTRPVMELDHAMQRVQQGDYSVRVRSGRMDELGRLSRSFDTMVQEYKAHLDRSVQRQRELNETQIRMLQAQLNPHFLYNTLDTVKWMGITENVPEVSQIATSLAALLRAGISDDRIITLERELELVNRYLDVQAIRFADRFVCEIDVPDDLQWCRIPKLVLQPIVENAVVHGVAGREDGYIKVTARRGETDETLVIEVTDNGSGMDEATLSALQQGTRLQGGHLGLYNVAEILRLYYGEQYGLQVTSAPGRGSRVRMTLPFVREESRENT